MWLTGHALPEALDAARKVQLVLHVGFGVVCRRAPSACKRLVVEDVGALPTPHIT